MRYLLIGLLALVMLGGCATTKSRLVGTWKVKEMKSASDNVGDRFMVGLSSMFMQGMVFEFNDEGKVKISIGPGSGEGTYKIEGNEVHIVGNDKKEADWRFKIEPDGKTMRVVKEFKSDPDIILEKVDSEQP